MKFRQATLVLLLWAVLAAAQSATWCGGFAKPAVAPERLQEIVRRVEETPADVAGSVKSLAEYLTQSYITDIEKVRAIYEWIIRKISYDTMAYQSGVFPDQSAEAVLKRRTGICTGYARLFEALARESGLEASEIVGFSRGAGYVLGATTNQRPDHAWSAVKIDGRWHLLDCTWAAGYVDDNNKFVRQPCEFYFLTPPDFFIYDHLPEDAQWQLLENKVDKAQFESMVYLRPAFFEKGLTLVTHKQGIIKEDCCFAMSFAAPDDVLLNAQVVKGDQKDEASSVFIQREGDYIKLNTAFASSGAYVLRLFAKKSGDKAPYDWAADYLIEVEAGSGSGERFPKAFSTFHERRVTLFSPFSGTLKMGETVKFSLAAPGAYDVSVVVGDKWYSLARTGDMLFEGEVVVNSDEVRVAGRYPGSESHYVLLKYTVSS